MKRILTSILAALTYACIQSASAQVMIESRVPGGGVNIYPPYREVGTWTSTTLKSTAPGVTTGVGSRFATNGVPAFAVKPTLVPDKEYLVEVTHGLTSSIPTNLLAAITITGGSGLPAVTDVFARAGANAWEVVGKLTLQPGVSEPEVTFTYVTNQLLNSATRRFYADAVRFTEVTADPPQIVEDPSSRTNLAGTTATFSVSATGGYPLMYQWRKDGVTLTNGGNVFGVSTEVLTITNVSPSSMASYDVVVTNGYGSVVSASATLTVTNAPTFPPAITSQPQSTAILFGQTAIFSVGVSGTTPMSFRWTKDGFPLTNSVRISGVTNSSLIISNAALSDAGNYRVTVTNIAGATNSNIAVLTVSAIPPAITSQPLTQTLNAGQTATFSVSATGTAPFTYQWTHDGIVLSGATTSRLTITNVQTLNQGSYVVTVINAGGSAVSSPATLSIAWPGSLVFVESMVTSNLLNSNPPYLETSGIWTTAPLKSTAPGVNSGAASRFGTNSPAFTIKPTLLAGRTYSVAVTHGLSSAIPSNLFVNITVSGGIGLPGTTTAFSFPSANSWVEIGSLILDAGVSQPELTFSYATNQPAASFTRRFVSDAIRFLEIPTAPVIAASPADQSAFVGSNVIFTVTATGTDPLIYQWSKDGVKLVGATDSVLTVPNIQATDAGIYTVLVTNFVGGAVSSGATLTVNTPAAILVPPVSQEVIEGQNATFSVTAIGDAPLFFQWQWNGNDIPGATTPALNLTSVTSSNAGNYTVIVSNAYQVATATASLAVDIPPAVLVEPSDVTVAVGGSFSFSVIASGTDPLTYQWQFNGEAIPGATDATFGGNSDNFNSGYYRVVIANVAGSVTSHSAKLIKPIPAGVYNGLFYEADEVRHNSSGFLRMNLASSGSFTGKVSVAGSDYPFSGAFSDVHQVTVAISRSASTPLMLNLRLLTANQTDEATGTISDGVWTSDVLTDRAFYNTNNSPPQTGEYTMALIGNSDGLTSPGGAGIISVTIGADGSVSLHGGLASDNTSFHQSVPLARDGHWPVYVNLYGGQGSLLGWVNSNGGTNSFEGALSWIKRSGVGGNYTAGFTNELFGVCSTYTNPPVTSRVLDLTNVIMTLSGSSLNADLDFFGTIPIAPNNKIDSISGANQLKLKIKDNGRITGTLLWGPTKQSLAVNAIVLQQSGMAYGFFTAPDNTTGSFWLRKP